MVLKENSNLTQLKVTTTLNPRLKLLRAESAEAWRKLKDRERKRKWNQRHQRSR